MGGGGGGTEVGGGGRSGRWEGTGGVRGGREGVGVGGEMSWGFWFGLLRSQMLRFGSGRERAVRYDTR